MAASLFKEQIKPYKRTKTTTGIAN